MGPFKKTNIFAANSIVWAHFKIKIMLPMALGGPVTFLINVANSIAWAHIYI
jgi:hypothetical protein